MHIPWNVHHFHRHRQSDKVKLLKGFQQIRRLHVLAAACGKQSDFRGWGSDVIFAETKRAWKTSWNQSILSMHSVELIYDIDMISWYLTSIFLFKRITYIKHIINIYIYIIYIYTYHDQRYLWAGSINFCSYESQWAGWFRWWSTWVALGVSSMAGKSPK